jgi:hypothetical protein
VRQAPSGGRNAPASPLIQGNRCAHAEEHPKRDDGGGLGDCVYAASDGVNEALCTCGYALDRLGREVNLLEIHAGVLGHVDDAIAFGVSVWGHSTGPAPTSYSQAARRRAPRSAPVAPRGSGRSRRVVPQRQTRPEARTHGQARLQAVVLGAEITPHSLWKLWVTRMCEPRALHASGSSDEVAARLYPVAPGAPTTQTFGLTRPPGGAVELSVHDYWLKPGPGERVCRMTPSALGRGCRSPGFTLIVGRDTRQNQGQPTPPRQSGRPDLNRGPLVPQTCPAVGRLVSPSVAKWPRCTGFAGAESAGAESLTPSSRHELVFARLGALWALHPRGARTISNGGGTTAT